MIFPGQRAGVEIGVPCPDTHVGMWLDRYLTSFGEETAKASLIEAAQDIGVPSAGFYEAAFLRWKDTISASESAKHVLVRAVSRVAIDLGADAVAETNLRLHHTYGVPVLPGTALKGISRNTCLRSFGGARPAGTDGQENPALEAIAFREDLGKDDPRGRFLPSRAPDKDGPSTFDLLFGYQGRAGCVIFHDGWYVPGSSGHGNEDKPLLMDVMTVHHADYYGEKSGKTPNGHECEVLPPADWDNPNPVQYVDVRPGACFLVVLEGPEGWRDLACKILLVALQEEGIGAKGTSGYGRMIVNEDVTAFENVRKKQVARALHPYWQQLEETVPAGMPARMNAVFDQCCALPSPHEQSAAAAAFLREVSTQNWRNRHPMEHLKLHIWAAPVLNALGLRATSEGQIAHLVQTVPITEIVVLIEASPAEMKRFLSQKVTELRLADLSGWAAGDPSREDRVLEIMTA